jgi:hypothetical protein
MSPDREDRESFLTVAADVAELRMEGGAGIEGALRLLRNRGVSMEDTIEIFMRLTGRSRPDASELVRTSGTWRDRLPPRPKPI